MKTAFVIGRFQPFHNGHKKLIDFALTKAEQVVVIMGDTHGARSFRDPWTIGERALMILNTYNNGRVRVTAVYDVPYDDYEWSCNVRELMNKFCDTSEQVIVGMQKDSTTFYLDLFPNTEVVKMPVEDAYQDEDVLEVSGTAIRRIFFDTENPNYHVQMKWVKSLGIPYPDRYLACAAFEAIREEYRAIREDEVLWRCAGAEKYGQQPKVAVDALVHTPTRVLLIERGGARGRGNFALPGGYLDPGERLYKGALRELKEEAGITFKRDDERVKWPANVIPYDATNRSSGIRTITNVLEVRVTEEFADENVPVPGDDAQNAFWADKSSLHYVRDKFFSDHWHIINIQLGESNESTSEN